MREGLLWFDDDPKRDLSTKVKRAADGYQAKFHRKPTVCYVNSADLNEELEAVGKVSLRTAKNVLRYHFWIGVDETMNKAA